MTQLDAAADLPAPSPTTVGARAAAGSPLRAAWITLFAALVAALVGIVVFSVWEPAFDGEIHWADTVALGSAYWPMNVLLGGPAYAICFVASAIFLVVLGAGSRLALAGSVLLGVGGIVFALVITAEVLPFAWAADPAIVDPVRGEALFAAYNEQFDAFVPYVVGSMAAIALGSLMAIGGAVRAGGLPGWVLGVAVVLIVLNFALPWEGLATGLASLAQRVLWAVIGWYGLRKALDA